MKKSLTIFESRNLTKWYGQSPGVEEISISIEKGEIFGFLGPNGAGKTTVIRSALGLLKPTGGEVKLFDETVKTNDSLNHERIGYLPADLRLWPGMNARKTSDLFIKFDKQESTIRRRNELAERLKIDLDRRVKNLSLGNRQKVGLLIAMQHSPELIILDEPTSGLDPLVRRSVIELLEEAAAEGCTIIYSSHNLDEVERICSRVGILRKGRLAALKTIDEIKDERTRKLEVLFSPGTEVPESIKSSLTEFKPEKKSENKWIFSYNCSPSPLIEYLTRFKILEITSPQLSLEEAFLTYYRDADLAKETLVEKDRIN